MRRFQFALAAIGLLALLAAHSRAGSEANDILEKAVKAHYPKGKDNNHAYLGKNKGTIHIGGMELEFNQQVFVHAPTKFKEVVEFSLMGQGVKVTSGFNGKEGWIKVNDMNIDVKDELLDEFKEMSYMMGVAQLFGLNDKSLKLSLLGEVQVNGKPSLGVKFSKEGKKAFDLYFDKSTGLLSKTERRARDFQSGQEVTEERIVTAYQEVAGRKMAKSVTVMRDGKKFLDAEMIEARVLPKLDDSEFTKP